MTTDVRDFPDLTAILPREKRELRFDEIRLALLPLRSDAWLFVTWFMMLRPES